jgi:carbon dioxide concentrating mechanism protein CcmL
VIFGKVAGTVVLTQRADQVPGAKFLLVEACTPRLVGRGEYVVALDVVGAGEGELVMVAQGPSARNTRVSDRRSIDAVICGIVDLVEERGAVVYRK